MKKRYCLPIFLLFIFGLSNGLLAQLTVEGMVTNQKGDPLPGANVYVDGQDVGTSTDRDGLYSLLIPDASGDIVLQVRFLGYKGQSKTVSDAGGVTTVNFELREDVLQMDQVVVTGNSVSAEKGTLGNSIATVNASQFEDAGVLQIDAALSGKVAGAQIQQASGTPGGGTSVRIRGTSTINRSAEPLYIVDGVIIDNSSTQLIDLGGYSSNRVADLDPNDIERIEIVKGAAAAALYGSRANDGVVQIFTRRGEAGKLKITYRNSYSFESLENQLDVNQSPVNAAGESVERFDYQDDLFRSGYTYNSSIAISGGDSQTRYYLSGSFVNQEGILEATDYRKENLRLNLDRTLFSWLDLSTNFNYIHSNASLLPNAGLTSLFGVLTNFFFTPNDYPLAADPVTGEYPRAFLFANPLESIANWQAPQEIDRFIGGFQLNAVPASGLALNYRFGFDNYTQSAQQLVPRGAAAPSLSEGLAIAATSRASLINSDLDISYTRELSSLITSTTSAGMNYQQQEFDIASARAENLLLLTGTVQGSRQFSSQALDKRRTLGFYGQQNFGINNLLFLTGALRSDASSAFGKDERQQIFPKASASFQLSGMEFWKNTFGERLNRFRLRTALGFSGGQPAGSFERFSNYLLESNSGRPGIVNSTIRGNEGLKPERMREFEIGGEMELLDGRIGLEVTFYNQETDDLLLPRTLAPSTGFASQLANVGTLTNKGLELLVRALSFRSQSFSWTTTFTMSTNDPLIETLSDGGAFFIPESFGVIRVEEGEAPGHFYGTTYVRDGSGNILDGNGDPIEDGAGNIVGIPAIGPRDIIGDPNPEMLWTLTNEMSIGSNFALRLQFDAVVGNDVFNFDRRLLETPAFGAGAEYERELAGEVPTGYFAARRSIFEEYIEDGGFIKLRELSARYTLRPQFVKNFGLNNIQLSVTGRNLLTFTDYTGWDPETNAGSQRTLVRGFGFGSIPIPRSVVFGLTINY